MLWVLAVSTRCDVSGRGDAPHWRFVSMKDPSLLGGARIRCSQPASGPCLKCGCAWLQVKASVAYFLLVDNRRRMPSSAYLKEELSEASEAMMQHPTGVVGLELHYIPDGPVSMRLSCMSST